jgi:hypothetical protein
MGFLIHQHRSVTVRSSSEHWFSSHALSRRVRQPHRVDRLRLTVHLTHGVKSQRRAVPTGRHPTLPLAAGRLEPSQEPYLWDLFGSSRQG